MAGKKCIVCLNNVKANIKQVAQHGLDDQLLIMYLLRKLLWTPVSNNNFSQYLKTGNPSDWAALCHICGKQVKEALDLHRQVEKLLYRISSLRRNLFEENLYESDSNDEDGIVGSDVATDEIFFKLRRLLISDYRSNQWLTSTFQRSVFIKYHHQNTTTFGDGEDNHEDDHCEFQVRQSKERVKHEPVSDDDAFDDNDNYSDSMMVNSVTSYYDHTVAGENALQDEKPAVKQLADSPYGDLEVRRHEKEIGVEENKSTSTSKKDPSLRKRGRRKGKIYKRKNHHGSNNNLAPIPEDIPRGTKVCPLCGNKFANGSAMRRHYRESHLKATIMEHRCPYCEQSYIRKECIQRHLQQIHPEWVADVEQTLGYAQKKSLCPHCEKKFYTGATLRRHVQRVHPNGDEIYKCDQCDSNYKSKASLNSHKISIHGQDTNNLNLDDCEVAKRTCKICGNIFRTESFMKRHIKESHEKIKEHGCNLCSKVFARRPYLFRHIQNEHRTGTPDPVSCKICNKTCNGEASLSRHMQNIHKQRQNAICNICCKKYTQIAALNIHLRFAHGKESKTRIKSEKIANESSPSSP